MTGDELHDIERGPVDWDMILTVVTHLAIVCDSVLVCMFVTHCHGNMFTKVHGG